MDFETIKRMRQKEQAKRGMPLTPDDFGRETQGGIVQKPEQNELAFFQQGLSQVPDEPALDIPDEMSPQRARIMELEALNPASTLQTSFEKIAQKYAILDIQGQYGAPPGGGV